MRIINLSDIRLDHLTIVPGEQRLDLVISVLDDTGATEKQKGFRYYSQNTLPGTPDVWTDLLTQGMIQAYQDLMAALKSDLSWVFDEAAIPRSPLSCQAVYNPDTSEITVSWQDRSDSEDGFYVERSADLGATWSAPVQVAAGSTSAVDSNVTLGETYVYRVSAFNAAGTSKASNTATIAL